MTSPDTCSLVFGVVPTGDSFRLLVETVLGSNHVCGLCGIEIREWRHHHKL